jgi:hypothetical protein
VCCTKCPRGSSFSSALQLHAPVVLNAVSVGTSASANSAHSLNLFIVPLSADTSSATVMSNTALELRLTIGNPLTQLFLASHPSTYSFQLDWDHTDSGSSLISLSATTPDEGACLLKLVACLCAQLACRLTARLLGLASLRKLMSLPFTCRAHLGEWCLSGGHAVDKLSQHAAPHCAKLKKQTILE